MIIVVWRLSIVTGFKISRWSLLWWSTTLPSRWYKHFLLNNVNFHAITHSFTHWIKNLDRESFPVLKRCISLHEPWPFNITDRCRDSPGLPITASFYAWEITGMPSGWLWRVPTQKKMLDAVDDNRSVNHAWSFNSDTSSYVDLIKRYYTFDPGKENNIIQRTWSVTHLLSSIHPAHANQHVMWSGYDRGSGKLDAASNSQQETLADIEHISTIAGSLGSIGTISQSGDGEPVYETDHTDLNSEYDEVELRRELMKDVSMRVWMHTNLNLLGGWETRWCSLPSF